ncbi:MAG: outer membrane protein assembly factor BamA, partial [alpha proteobacterium MED-G10]
MFFFSQFVNALVLTFLFSSFTSANTPGTPSSSYSNDYFLKKEGSIINTTPIIPRTFSQEQSQIVIQGNKRLESELILRSSGLKEMGLDDRSFSQAIKNLYRSGYFSDVNIYKSKGVVYVNVRENPIIDLISIEGNKEITDEIILEEIGTRPRNVFSRELIKNDSEKILTLYKRQGFFSTFVEPKIIKVDENRVNLVFEVFEGKEATIKKVNFTNNKIFSDSTLKDVISSTEYRWYEFWGTNDRFDKDRINYDKDLLKKYYFDNGYIDFEIVSVNSSLVDNRKDFIVNFTIFEGKRYKITNVKFNSSIRNLSSIKIKDLVDVDKGDWFSSKELDDAIKKITDETSKMGYAFVDISPRIKKIGDNKVEVTFEIQEGTKIFIDRINISGNVKTNDDVIRRELTFVEGDAYNSSKIKESERHIRGTGLFDNIEIKIDEMVGTNKTEVDVGVTERSTGQFTVGAGFSSLDGAIGSIGIKESNLFGEAKELSLNLGLSTRKSEIDLSFTDPYFLNKDLAAGIDIFNIRRNQKTYSGYKHNIIGFKLRTGFEIIDNLRYFSSYTLKRDKIHDIDNDTSIYIQAQEGKRVTSVIGQALQYDELNDRINPTDGYRVRFDVDYFGLGGDSEHILTELKIANFLRITDGVILGNFLEGGYIASIKEVKINDLFFLNGDQLRGFKNLGVGPRDSSTSDSLGGEVYYVNRNELTFPIGLPDDLGIGGLIFADIGTVYNTSSSGSNIRDESSLRASAGIGLSWLSPFGPVKFYLSKAILKENYDKKEIFRFSFGTTY